MRWLFLFDKPKDKAFLSGSLKNDQKTKEDVIGITHRIRLNPYKLNQFIESKKNSWHKKAVPEIAENPNANTSNIKNLSGFARENYSSTFTNYDVNTSSPDGQPATSQDIVVRQQMLDASKKFAQAVIDGDGNMPLGFVMSGEAGIGKTHLANSVVKHVAANGKKVLYVDQQMIKDSVRYSENENGDIVTDKDVPKLFESWIKGVDRTEEPDLIVLDDINSRYDLGENFLKYSLKFALTNNKAIMVSSNTYLRLKDLLPTNHYIGFDSPASNSFLVLDDLKAKSLRKAWNVEGNIEPSLEGIVQYQGSQSAAIVIEDTGKFFENKLTNESSFKKFFENKFGEGVRIGIVGPSSIRGGGVIHQENYYMKNNSFIDNNDVFIFTAGIRKFGQPCEINYGTHIRNDCEQLLNLAQKVHDKSKKIVIITPNNTKFFEELKYAIKISYSESQRITERCRILIPGFEIYSSKSNPNSGISTEGFGVLFEDTSTNKALITGSCSEKRLLHENPPTRKDDSIHTNIFDHFEKFLPGFDVSSSKKPSTNGVIPIRDEEDDTKNNKYVRRIEKEKEGGNKPTIYKG